MNIRAIVKEEWTEAMALTWRTFLKFEANEYEPEGVKSFFKFITNSELEKMFLIGEYKVFGAFEKGKIVGIIGARGITHISLLFVDEEYHHQGIATKLVDTFIKSLQEEGRKGHITVNSSPYAVGFYHHIGFVDTNEAQKSEGIIYTPMHKEF